jgi:hypothetical protein
MRLRSLRSACLPSSMCSATVMLARRAPSIASDERRLLQVRLDRGPSGGVEALSSMLPRSISARDEASVSHCCPKGTGAQGLSGRRGTLCSVESVNGALLAEPTGGGSTVGRKEAPGCSILNCPLHACSLP